MTMTMTITSVKVKVSVNVNVKIKVSVRVSVKVSVRVSVNVNVESGLLRRAQCAVHRYGGSSVLLGNALEGDVVAKHLAGIDKGQYLLGDACSFATNSQDATGTAYGDVCQVLNKAGRQHPLVAIELIERTPTLTRKLEDGLHTKYELGDVVLLILEIGIATHGTLLGVAVELELVVNLKFAFGPLVCKVYKLQLFDIYKAELNLNLVLL